MSKGSNKKKTLTPRQILLSIIVIVVLSVFGYGVNVTINYPYSLWFFSSLLLGIIIFCVKLKSIIIEAEKFKSAGGKAFFIGLKLCTHMVASILIIAALLIPVNYYNINYADGNISHIHRCKIVQVANRSRNHSISYIFENKTQNINARVPEMDEMNSPEKYGRYHLTITVKKGLWGTYILQNWKLERSSLAGAADK